MSLGFRLILEEFSHLSTLCSSAHLTHRLQALKELLKVKYVTSDQVLQVLLMLGVCEGMEGL